MIVLAFALFVGGAFAIIRASGGTVANLTLATQPATEDGLLLHWTMDATDFDESKAGAQVRDRSGNANHGSAVFPSTSSVGYGDAPSMTATSTSPLATAFASTTKFLLTAGGVTNWTVPDDWSDDNIIELVGGGGAGWTGGNNQPGGGGGGGAYAKIVDLAGITPGGTVKYKIGPGGINNTDNQGGDTWFNGDVNATSTCNVAYMSVCAKGGATSTSTTGGKGGEAGQSFGEGDAGSVFSGGDGGTGLSIDASGGGGGAAGPWGNGGRGGNAADGATDDTGGGGGGAGGGSPGQAGQASVGGAGGNNFRGTGSGAGGDEGGAAAGNGLDGGGGGGGDEGGTTQDNGAPSAGGTIEWTSSLGTPSGPGGGGGGCGDEGANGGNGGDYGGGGGGCEDGPGGGGGQGIIVITYSPRPASETGVANTATTTPGRIGQALSFDGGDDYINAGDIAALSFTDGAGNDRPYSISTWLYLNDISSAQGIVTRWETAPNGEWLLYTSNSDLLIENYTEADTYRIGRGLDLTEAHRNRWMHVVATYDGSESANGFRIYIDSVRSDTTDSTFGTYTGMVNSAGRVQVGAYDNGQNQLDGKVDDVRVFNRTLSADEVFRLYQLGGTTKVNTTITTEPELERGLVGHWTMDGKDIASTTVARTAIDRSGQGNTGTMSSNPLAVPGKIGQGIYFDGTDDYINIGNYSVYHNTRYTYSIWVKGVLPGEVSGSVQKIIEKDEALTINWRHPSGPICEHRMASDWVNSGTSGKTIPAGVWSHIVCLYDGDRMAMYVDGKLFSENPVSTDPVTTSDPLRIGAQSRTPAAFFFNGSVDDARVYNRALSADEVLKLYQLGGTAKLNTTVNTQPNLDRGLVGHWTLDGKDIASTTATRTAIDRSGQGNTGTMSSNPLAVPGRIGQALDFDGSDDLVNLGTPAALDFAQDSAMSMSAWVSFDAFPGTGVFDYIIGKGYDNSTEAYFLRVNGTGKVLESGSFSSATEHIASIAITWNTREWHHVVSTYNGTAWTLYVEGSFANTTTTEGPEDNAVRTVIGALWREGTGAQRLHNGKIDDVRIYNRALSASEVQQLYNLGAN